MKTVLRYFGRGLRNGLVSIGALAFAGGVLALANYTATQGSGTTFGSIIVSAVHYAQQLVCDPVTPSNCAAVKAANTVTSSDVGAVVAVANVTTAIGNNADGVAPTSSGNSPVDSYEYFFDGTNWNRKQTCLSYHLSGGTTASTNSNAIKSSAAGTLCVITGVSTSGTLGFLKLYDSAGAPTCSSATGLKHVYPIPANTSGAGINIAVPDGERYTNGIGFCVTGGGGDTDNTNAPTGIYIEASYK